ncbi:MAG: hypothetical protein HYS57_00730 [Parcubacteria group bacterium]|nr:hypothetical protein [Parcubacteria group bacterium]
MTTHLAALCKTHRFALLVAFLVGIIYIAPHLLFQWSLGDAYRGIPLMQTANEDEYLLRMQEILDGHPSLGSPVFFEYKSEPPLNPPVGEFLYVLPTIIFGISPVNTLIASRFFLPALLFLLVYALMLRLTGDGGWQQRLNAIACGLLIVLGYDLIDYRTVLSYLQGHASPGSFLLWSRPVNPILGALFLLSFLLLVWAVLQKTQWRKSAIISAAVFLALMFGSYFFSWGIALSALAVLILFLLARKEYKTAGTLAFIAPLGALFALPYWLAVWRAAQSPWYEASVLRSGLFLTHYPLLNKLLLVTLFFFLALLVIDFLVKRKRGIAFRPESWHWLCLSLLMGGLVAYSQQMLTGRTIWPYHFVQYTIPLSLVVGVVVLHRIVRGWSKVFWAATVSAATAASFLIGIYTQASVYATSAPSSAEIQDARPLFDWLNSLPKDCVVLQAGNGDGPGGFDNIIPAFTKCNLYDSLWVFSLLPEERIRHNYLTRLFFKGVTAETIEKYLQDNRHEARGRLYANWKGLYGVPDFPDFSDEGLSARIDAFADDYRHFYGQNMTSALRKYRVDVILSSVPLTEEITKRLPTIKMVAEISGNFIYQL